MHLPSPRAPAAPEGYVVTASVSNAAPTRNSSVTATGVLTCDAVGADGVMMTATWHYNTTTSTCTGTNTASGATSCSRQLGNGVSEADLLVHDETLEDPTLAFLLSRLDYPDYPVSVGIFRAVQRPTYEVLLEEEITDAIAKEGEGNLEALLRQGDIWTVE
jgi:hypothetical protein